MKTLKDLESRKTLIDAIETISTTVLASPQCLFLEQYCIFMQQEICNSILFIVIDSR